MGFQVMNCITAKVNNNRGLTGKEKTQKENQNPVCQKFHFAIQHLKSAVVQKFTILWIFCGLQQKTQDMGNRKIYYTHQANEEDLRKKKGNGSIYGLPPMLNHWITSKHL